MITHADLPANLGDIVALDELAIILRGRDNVGPDPYDWGFAPSVVADYVDALREYLIEHNATLHEVADAAR